MRAEVEINHFRGAVLIAQKENVVLSDDFGQNMARADGQNPSRYRIGSIAKQFTAAAVLQLSERNNLKLDDSVCSYISKCPASWSEIRIVNLLDQTDGIPDVEHASTSRSQSVSERFKLPAEITLEPLQFKPGTGFRYSNSGYAVLTAVIEGVSGESYSRFVESELLSPSGMGHTVFDFAEGSPERVRSRSITPDDLTVTAIYGWDHVESTVNDLYRWVLALHREGLLSADSRKRMFTPYNDGYGFGWAILKEFGRPVETQAAGTILFGSAIRFYPADDVCVIVLSNSEGADAGKISRDMAAIVFGKHYELPTKHSPINLDPSTYTSYAGRYQVSPDFVLTVSTEANHLMIQGSGLPKIELLPESETRFFGRGLESAVNFVKGPQGETSQLVLQQGGRDIAAPRIE